MSCQQTVFHYFIWTLLVICNFHWLQPADGAKILGIPLPTYSHVSESNAVAEELVKRGHQVIFYLPDDFDNSKSAPNIPNIRYGKNTIQKLDDFINKVTKLAAEGRLTPLTLMRGSGKLICTEFSKDIDGLEKLRQEKFDFVIIDYLFFIKCYFLVPYNLSIPFATVSSAISMLDAGHPLATSVTPFFMTPYTPNMAFHERIINTFVHLLSVVALDFILESYDYSKMAPGLSWNELQGLSKKAEIYLENTDTIFSYPKPLMPNFIQVGGLTVKPAKPLPTNIKKFFDEATHGVIIVSFGSTFKPNRHIQNVFMSVFLKLKQKVFWKIDDEKEIGNVLTSKWLPQNDALAHPNTKLLIYHCGNNGMFESLYHGVPLLCVPQAADQFMNSRKLDYLNIGRFFDVKDLAEELLQEHIMDLLENPTYTTNMKHLSEIFRSRPESPSERAASGIEHVIKYGGKHLRLHQVDQSAFQLLAVDVWFAIFLLLFIFIKLLCYILHFCKRFVCSVPKIKQN